MTAQLQSKATDSPWNEGSWNMWLCSGISLSTACSKVAYLFLLPQTVTTGLSSDPDSSPTVESVEDNPDGGCHIYRNGYYGSSIDVVGKDVGQHLNRGMLLTMNNNVW